MPVKPTTKAHKLAVFDWQVAFNKAKFAWTQHKLKTFADLMRHCGLDPAGLTDDHPLTYKDILEFFEHKRDELDKQYEVKEEQQEQQTTTANTQPADDSEEPELAFEALPNYSNQRCRLYPFQERAASALALGITVQNKRGQLLRAAVGTGKTFIIGRVAAHLKAIGFTKGKTFSPWPMVYVTKASIVEQTKRVLKEQFGLCTATECIVINIEQLRASFGELFVGTQTVVQDGQEYIKWKWKEFVHPLVIFWDECQILKNTDSQQSEIAQAFNDINAPETVQIYFSATPFMRVCEAKCFAVSTRLKNKYGFGGTVALNNENWQQYAAHIAHPAEPEEYSPAAVERLMDSLNDYIVDVKGVRPQFNAYNKVLMIDFSSPEEAKFYHDAWERYEMMKEKIQGYNLSGSQSRFLILAQFTIFRKAAELCRCDYFAEQMYAMMLDGKAPVLAVNFKGTIRRTVKILCEKYGVKRDDIALIWGGGKTQASKKQKAKKAIVETPEVLEILRASGITLSSLHLDDVEDYVDSKDDEDDKYRLGAQSLKARQVEIDRFQSGKARFAMFTFKAGGVGLSLHHTDEMTRDWKRTIPGFDQFLNEITSINAKANGDQFRMVANGKVRKTKANWAVVDDIKFIPTRPRVTILAPTFSAIELVQGLGRCPRLTSLSDTNQTIVFYRGTIEERVAAIVSQKLRCLRKVVRTRESWETCIVGGIGKDDTRLVKMDAPVMVAEAEDSAADNTAALFGGDTDDDEEEDDD